jgi:hypothetical protein
MLNDYSRVKFLSSALIVVCALSSSAIAMGQKNPTGGTDVLRLRDGNVLRGSLVGCDAKTVRFRTIAGVGTYARGGVVSITLVEASSPPKAIAAIKTPPAKKVRAPLTQPLSSGESEPAAAKQSGDPAADENTADTAEPPDPLTAFRKNGLIPAGARPNDPVLERDLTAMVGLITKSFSKEVDNPITPEKPAAPVSRARALTAIVKISALPSDVDAHRSPDAAQMPPDGAKIPGWARPYVCIALEQNWWPAAKPFDASGVATWQFIAAILEHTPYSDIGPLPAKPVASSDPDAHTGLIIDARDLPLQRSMSVRVLSRSGGVLYPHPDHIPDIGFVQDHGMASYIADAGDHKRSGKKPLEVTAIDVSAGGNDVVVDDETAELIREANRTGKFLWRWAVSILVK